MERIIDVAQYIYDEYKRQSGEVINEMKLHKLLYLSQRESIAITNEPMFPESFEGWKYGPVSKEVRALYMKSERLMKVIKSRKYGILPGFSLCVQNQKTSGNSSQKQIWSFMGSDP